MRKYITALVLLGSLLLQMPLTAGASTSPWYHWARNNVSTVDAITNELQVIHKDASAGNDAGLKVALRLLSIDAVSLASIADSPSKVVNSWVVKTAEASNAAAWDGYLYLQTQSNSYLGLYRYDISQTNSDFNGLTNSIKPYLKGN
jgi:hypothetical protein